MRTNMRKIQPGTHGTCPWTSLAMAGLLASGVWGPAIAQDAWSLGPPIARIGEGQTPEYELDRVASLLVRGERLYVADRSQQIRAYDLTTGTIIAVGGGSGQGPGEFRALDWIDDCNSDQLFASDGIQDRISVFSLALEHIRTFRLGRDAWLRSARCAGPDGFIGVHGKESEGATEIPPGPYRMAVELSIFSSTDGSRLNTFGEYPGEDRYREEVNDGPQQWGRTPLLESLPEGFVLGTNESWSLTRHDVRGNVIDSLTIDEERRRISGSDINAFIDSHIEGQQRIGRDHGFLAGRRRYLEEYEYPTHYPAYSSILSSNDGSVWVERYTPPLLRSLLIGRCSRPKASLWPRSICH